MARRFSVITTARFRVDRAEEAWRSLIDLVREATPAPGYAGPTIEEVERILVDIEAAKSAIMAWRGAEAARAEAGRRIKTSAASRVRAERRRQRRAKPAAPASPAEVHAAAEQILKSGRAQAAMGEVERILAMTR